MIFSVHMDGQLDLFLPIFHPRCMVIVRIVRSYSVKVSLSVNWVRVSVRVSVNMVTVRIGTENSACHIYICPSWTENK